MLEETLRELAESLVDKIEEAGDGYSIRLTRLVDDEAEYTLFYDGVETKHPDHQEASEYFQSIVRKEKIDTAAALLLTRSKEQGEEIARLRLVARRVIEWMRAVDDEEDDLEFLNTGDGWGDMRETADLARAALGGHHD